MKVGYIRVSSVDQNSDRQLDGIELDKVFEEKVSGKNMNRKELKTCLDFLREGDVLHVHSMDRLARNLKDLLTIVHDLNDKSVTVKFITENLEFSGNDNPMGLLMLSLLGAVHQFELAMIRNRQAEGIRKAKERGQQLGRAPLDPKLVQQIKKRLAAGEKVPQIALSLEIGTSTVYKYKNAA